MNEKLKMYTALLSACIITLLALNVISVNADSTTLYLDWRLEDNQTVYGHLTLSNFPKVMEKNKTYKIEVILTLESGNNQDLGCLKFKVTSSENDNYVDLGYSFINSVLNQSDSVTLVSHWKVVDPIDYNGGKLVVDSDKGKFILSPEENEVKFPVKNILSINVPEEVSRGDVIFITGSMNPSEEGMIISLTYLQPNGTEIIRSTTVDSEGVFTDSMTPDTEGKWLIKASFNGTQDYDTSLTDWTSFNVQPVMPFLLILALTGLIGWASVTLWVYKNQINEERINGEKIMQNSLSVQ